MEQDSPTKNSELGTLVAKYRKAQGRTSRDVAREAKLDIHTVTMLERGGYASPSPHTLRAVSKALSIPLVELFQAAGYLSPYDLVEMLHSPVVEPILAEQDALEERSRYIAELIEKHGLDYTGLEYTSTID